MTEQEMKAAAWDQAWAMVSQYERVLPDGQKARIVIGQESMELIAARLGLFYE